MTDAASNLKVLALDTSTESCSAALLLPGGAVVLRSVLTERGHADLILPMVDEVLADAGVTLAVLDGLAFGRGPGGFTGVRIAAGVIQGLAYGAGLKVAPVSSLAAVAFFAAAPAAHSGVLVCNDARMNELYWACYRVGAAGGPSTPVALSPERVSGAAAIDPVPGVSCVAGNGLARHPELRARLEEHGLRVLDGLYPRADAIAHIGAAMLARGEWVEAADAVPTYVRDDVARPPAGPTVT